MNSDTNSDDTFESSIESLHSSAGSITRGLEGLVDAIDAIAHENAAFIEGPDTLPEGPSGDAIRNLLGGIRTQITEIVDHSHQFESKLNAYSSEIGDLSRQLEQTRQAAMLDPTTGIGNRRHFEEALKDILGHLSDYNHKVSVLLADVDNFKTVNDTFGHGIGDQVLRLVAETFVTNLKGGDVVARWGGDEFAAILPNTSLEHAMSAAENVRNTLASRSLKNKDTGKTMGKLTISIGVATYRQGDNAHKLIFRSDQALYEAKRLGRNRTAPEKL